MFWSNWGMIQSIYCSLIKYGKRRNPTRSKSQTNFQVRRIPRLIFIKVIVKTHSYVTNNNKIYDLMRCENFLWNLYIYKSNFILSVWSYIKFDYILSGRLLVWASKVGPPFSRFQCTQTQRPNMKTYTQKV